MQLQRSLATVLLIGVDEATTMSDSMNIEQTPIGDQYLIGDIKPVSQREKLELLATLPMQPKRARYQKPCDLGLFDDVARNQMDLL